MMLPDVVHVSSAPPTRCGVAEYTSSLSGAMGSVDRTLRQYFVRLDYDSTEPQQSRNCVSINPSNRDAIDIAAAAVNKISPRCVLLQHEFKLYGGQDGQNVLRFLGNIKAPVITTLHTVAPSFTSTRDRIFREVLNLSARLVIFSEEARRILTEDYGVETQKVRSIPHGVPDIAFAEPGTVGLPGVTLRGTSFISCGLIRPAKGIEAVLEALARVKASRIEFTYVVCGGDHPRNPDAREYRDSLLDSVERHDLREEVIFINRFLDFQEMVRAIQSCDAGIFAYKSHDQSSSGVLALTLSCGRPVIATDFQYARAVVGTENGILVPSNNTASLASAIESFINSACRTRLALESYNRTRQWVWAVVAQQHIAVINELAVSVRT